MPVTTVELTASGQDNGILVFGANWPPEGTPSYEPSRTLVEASKVWNSGFNPTPYYVRNILLRFPLAAEGLALGSQVISGTLRMRVNAKADLDSRSISFGYFQWSGASAGTDVTFGTESNAHAGTTIASITTGVDQDFALLAPETWDVQSDLYLRGTITGTQPTADNYVNFISYDSDPALAPRLIIDYLPAGAIYRAGASAGTPSGTAQSTLTVTKPAGLAVDDWMIMSVTCSGGTGATITPPTATGTWTLLNGGRVNSTNNLAGAVYAKKATASDVAATNYTITFDGNRKAAASIQAYWHTDGPSQSQGQANASSTNVVAPSVPAEPNSRLLFLGSVNTEATFTPPTGLTERADQLGQAPAGAPAALNFYFLDAAQSGAGDHGAMQTTVPTTTNFATGWGVGILAPTRYADMDRGVDVPRTATDATYGWITSATTSSLNSTRGNAFRTPSPLSGSFASANWTYSFVMRAAVGTAQRGAMRVRLYRSANADGSGATQIAAGTAETGITTNATTTNTTAITATINPGALTLTNEYLFFLLTWKITTAGSGNTSVYRMTRDTNTRITTAAFSGVDSLAHEVAGELIAVSGATGTRTAVASAAGVNIGHAITLLHIPPPEAVTVNPGYEPSVTEQEYGALVSRAPDIIAGFDGPLLPGEYPPGPYSPKMNQGRDFGAEVYNTGNRRLYPTQIISMSGLSGDVVDVDEDPNDPDDRWLVVDGT